MLKSFNGGPGQIAVHGNGQMNTVGQNVSNGCIRVFNDVILQIAKAVPLGTPGHDRSLRNAQPDALLLTRRRRCAVASSGSSAANDADQRGELVGLLEREPVRRPSTTSRRASGSSAANISA